jgi:methyl-accepting chemotaxis protein
VEVKSESPDETGRLLTGLRQMRDGLARAVSMIRSSAQQVGAASKGNRGQPRRPFQPYRGAGGEPRETASSMEELESTVRQNNESARAATAVVVSTSETAARGGVVMDSVVGTMGGISDSSRRSATSWDSSTASPSRRTSSR